jgi:hypothetical protein
MNTQTLFPGAAIASLTLADHPGYLGDPAVVDAILRGFVKNFYDLKFASQDEHSANLETIKESFKIAGYFLGDGGGFAPVLPWNTPGYIDQHLKREFGITGGTPQETVAWTLCTMLMDFNRLAEQIAAGALPENTDWQPDAIIQTYTHLLMGIPLVDDSDFSPDDEADENEPAVAPTMPAEAVLDPALPPLGNLFSGPAVANSRVRIKKPRKKKS